MKRKAKKLLAMMLALCMVLTLIPAMPVAADEKVQWEPRIDYPMDFRADAREWDKLATEHWAWYPNGNAEAGYGARTLVLDGINQALHADYERANPDAEDFDPNTDCTADPLFAIRLPADSTIVVNGYNRVSDMYYKENSHGIVCEGALTIKGSGRLEVVAADTNSTTCSVGIKTYSLTVDMPGGSLKASGGNVGQSYSMGIWLAGREGSVASNLTIKNGDVEALGWDAVGTGNLMGAWTARSCGVYMDGTGTLTMDGGTLNAHACPAGGNSEWLKFNCGILLSESSTIDMKSGSIIASGYGGKGSTTASGYALRIIEANKGDAEYSLKLNNAKITSYDGANYTGSVYDETDTNYTVPYTSYFRTYGTAAKVTNAKITCTKSEYRSMYYNPADGKMYKEASFTNQISNVGGWSADSEGVLTLENFDYSTTNGVALNFTRNTTLNLVGDNNRINGSEPTVGGNSSYGISIANGVTVTVTGDGTLETKGGKSLVSSGVYGTGTAKLVMESGKLISTGEQTSDIAYGADALIELQGGEVTAKGHTQAFNKIPVVSADYKYKSGNIDDLGDWQTDFTALPATAQHVEIASIGGSTITFDANGGTVTTESAQTGQNGKLSALPTPDVRAAATFKGWFTKAKGGTEVTTNTAFTGDTTIYAQWEIAGAPFTITFNGNGGAVNSTTKQTAKDGRLSVLPSAERKWYAFQGWYTAMEGGQKITENTEFMAGTTVYAHWEKVASRTEELNLRWVYEDILDSDQGWKWYYNGTDEYRPKTLVIDGLDLRISAWASFGINLPGDSTIVINGTNSILSEGTAVSSIFADGYLDIRGSGILNISNMDNYCISAYYDVTLKSATVNVISNTYKVIHSYDGVFKMKGGVLDAMSYNTSPLYGMPVDMPTYTCWTNNDMVNPGGAGSKTYEHSDDYRYVKISCDYNIYTVFFNAAGGSVSTGSLDVGTNGKLSTLPTPTKDPAIFKGWFTKAEGGMEVTTNTVFTDDTTVYAQWEVAGAPFVITFDAAGGTINPERMITNKSGLLSTLPIPEREGQNFLGWFTADGNKITTDTMFLANTTAYAEWGAYTRTATLNMSDSTIQYNNGSEIVTANPNETDILDSVEGWKWYLNAGDGYEAHTLVLENLYLNTGDTGIIPQEYMTIVLKGTNIVEAGEGLNVGASLTIKGDGVFNIKSSGNCIKYENGSLVIEDGIINVHTQAYRAITWNNNAGSFNMKGGLLTAIADDWPVIPNQALSLPTSYTCWTNTAPVHPGGDGNSSYSYYAPNQYVRISDGRYTLYNVTFDANGGLVAQASSETDGNHKISSLPRPKRDSYTFDGWFTAATGGTEVTADNVFTGNTTIYAHWTYIVQSPIISVGSQNGTLTYGTSGSAAYTVTNLNFTTPAFAPAIAWSGTAPVGVTASFNGDKTQVTLTSTAVTNAGTYKFKVVSGTGANKIESAETELAIGKANYDLAPAKTVNIKVTGEIEQTGTLTVADFFETVPSGAEITNCTVQTGGTNVVSAALSVSGNGSLSYTGKTELDAGNLPADDVYTVTIKSNNYNDIQATLTFKATAKTPVTISGVSVANKTYNGNAVSYTGTPIFNDGTSNVVPSGYTYEWQDANGDTLATAPKDAGSYKLIVSVPESDANYTGSQEIDFTINQAQLTITAANQTINAGTAAPTYTYTVAGLASGETLKTAPVMSCTANLNVVGTYPITPSGAVVPDGGNYKTSITYVNGTLTVRAVNNFVAVTNITGAPTKGTVGTALTLSGTAAPSNATNKAITWKVKDKGTTGAVLKNGKLTFTGSGKAVVTATVRNGKTASSDYTKNFTITVTYPISKGKTYEVSGLNYKVTSITNSKKEVTFIGLTAAKKKSATTVTVGNTVKIKGITLNVTAIGNKALNKNTKVKTIKIGDKVLTIGDAAFSGCTALTSITIGKGLKTLGKEVFSGDKKLKTITIKSTQLSKVGNNAAKNVKATIKVPAAKVAAYKKLFKTYKNIKVTK